jgi:hypothetical protein
MKQFDDKIRLQGKDPLYLWLSRVIRGPSGKSFDWGFWVVNVIYLEGYYDES